MRFFFLVFFLSNFFLFNFTFAQIKVANDPSRIGVGARILGMGKGYVGMADDLLGIFINPAALSSVKEWQATSMSGKFINEVDYLNFGAAFPTPIGTLGIGYVGSSIGFIGPAATTEVVDGVRIIPSTTEGVSYEFGDRAALLSWGAGTERFSVGGSLKFFFLNMSGPGISGGSASGNEADVALCFKPAVPLKLGLVLQNALPFASGGKIKWGNQTEESLPSVLKAGMSLRLLGEKGLRKFGDHEIALNLDGDFFPNRPNIPALLHYGLEWSPSEFVDLRAGIDQDIVGTGSGLEPANNLTAGVGLYFGKFRFDYAFHQYNQVAENNTHYFSITYGVEKKKPIPLPPPTLPPPVVKKIRKPISFVDVPAGYWAKEPIEELATLGIISGYPDKTFRPEENVTRAEMCSLLMKTRETKDEGRRTKFKDVPAKHWAAKYIEAASGEKLVTGYPDGTFQPGKAITRAEGAAIIARFAKLPESRLMEVPFPDVSGRHWAIRFISAAKEEGHLKYLEGKAFEPNKKLTRAEAAEMLSKTKFLSDKIHAIMSRENGY